MVIKNAQYVVSSERVEQCPSDGWPEYAFIGRSNVGKSSLINMLTDNGKLAKTSATPGSDGAMYEYIDRLLENKTETTLVADCRFCGTRNDPSVRGAITNLSEQNFTPADFALAVLNGISGELYEMYKSGCKKAKHLVCSGNGMRKNAALRRVTAEMFGCDIKIPLYAEEASYGAALAATVACGKYKNIDEACRLIKYTEN